MPNIFENLISNTVFAPNRSQQRIDLDKKRFEQEQTVFDLQQKKANLELQLTEKKLEEQQDREVAKLFSDYRQKTKDMDPNDPNVLAYQQYLGTQLMKFPKMRQAFEGLQRAGIGGRFGPPSPQEKDMLFGFAAPPPPPPTPIPGSYAIPTDGEMKVLTQDEFGGISSQGTGITSPAKPKEPLSSSETAVAKIGDEYYQGTIIDGKFTPILDTEGKPLPATPKQTESAGTQVVINTGDIEKSTKASLEQDITDIDNTISALDTLIKDFEPDFLTIPGAAVAKVQRFADLWGKPEYTGTKFMEKRAAFLRDAQDQFVQYRKQITGVAGGMKEFGEIAKAFPKADKDSPREWMSKANAAIENGKRVRTLLNNIRAKGLPINQETVSAELGGGSLENRVKALISIPIGESAEEKPAEPIGENMTVLMPDGRTAQMPYTSLDRLLGNNQYNGAFIKMVDPKTGQTADVPIENVKKALGLGIQIAR